MNDTKALQITLCILSFYAPAPIAALVIIYALYRCNLELKFKDNSNDQI